MKDSIKYFILSLLFVFSFGQAQTPTLFFKSISTSHGLSSNDIDYIFQDRLGFIWFASDKGLDKYDGYSFRHFDFKQVVRDSAVKKRIKVNQVVEYHKQEKSLLLATDSGLLQVNTSNDSIDFYPNNIFENMKSISHIASGAGKDLWISKSKTVYHYISETDTLIPYKFKNVQVKNPQNLIVKDLLIDTENRIWVAAGAGLFLYQSQKDHFIQIELKGASEEPDNISEIVKLAHDGFGNLWILQKNVGLFRLSYDTEELKFYCQSMILNERIYRYNFTDMQVAEDGAVWIGTQGMGLIKFEPKTGGSYVYMRDTRYTSGLEGNRINGFMLDRIGTFWVSVEGFGLSIFPYSSTNFFRYEVQEPDYYIGSMKRIYTVYQDIDETIWLGPVNKNGIYRIDPNSGETTYYPLEIEGRESIIYNTISSIFKKNRSSLWVTSMRSGLNEIKTSTGSFVSHLTHVNDNKKRTKLKLLYNSFLDSQDFLWLNPGRSWMYRYEPKTKHLKKYHIRDPRKKGNELIRSFLETKDGQIIFGSNAGNVFRYCAKTDSLVKLFEISVTRKTGLPIRGLAEDNQGGIWMATNRGLFVYHSRSGKIEQFSESQGLITQNLSALLIDDFGNLWTSHNKGLSRFDIEFREFTNLNYQSGYSNHYMQNSYFKAPNGNLLFGSLNGCTVIKPRPEIKFQSAPLRITDIQINSSVLSTEQNREMKNSLLSGQEVELPYDNYGFTFDFSLLDFKEPLRNQFAYKLVGQSNKWQDIGNKHTLSFVGLPAGAYTFYVKGKSATGEWSTDEIAINFVIQTPFWKTSWFSAWLILIFLLIVFTIYRLRVYAIRLRNTELEAINRKLNDQINIRRQVEQMLVENEIKYRTLVEGIADGIFTLDAQGVFYFLNNTAAQNIGGVPSDFTGRSVYEFYPTDFADLLVKRVKEVLADGQSCELSAEIQQNGKLNHFDVTLHPLKNERGENTLVLTIAVDTSEKKALENQLRQSQKMEAIGNLAGGIAHDFNNLLSVIRGYSYLLLSDEKPGNPVYESLLEIDAAGERAQGLTRQLLAFSRKQLLEPKVVNLNTRIRDLHKMLQRLIRENIDIEMQLDSDLNHIFADPGQLDQVIINLILNARDAMPVGGKLTVRTQNSGKPKKLENIVQQFESTAYVELSISDTGIGMNKDTQQKIFEPFFTTKDKGKGTGLGLSTVFGIVKQSDGYIWVESESGKGSTFTVYFPAVDKETIAEEKATPERKELRGSETILVVEDEGSVCSMIVKMLKLYGYHTYVAANGEEGIRKFKEQHAEINLILSDVVMPDMSGVTMMQKILKVVPNCRYILMSGYTDEEIVRHGIVDRGIHFIQKPFTPDALMSEIRKTLDSESHLSSD